MKKKIISTLLVTTLALALSACGDTTTQDAQTSSTPVVTQTPEATSEVTPENVTIEALNGAGEKIEVTVPYAPERVAILDMAALDIIDNLDLGDCVVGTASTSLDYLQKYTTKEGVTNLGTIKEADLEAVMACEPEVIFIGGRLSSSYDALLEIAPVVYLATDSELGVVESTKKNAAIIASIFGKETELSEKLSGFDERIAALQAVAEGKTAVVGMCTSGSFNVLGNSGRCSIIGVELGFENLGLEAAAASEANRGGGSGNSGKESNSGSSEKSSSEQSSTNDSPHGNESTFELLVSLAPDYIFVLDRDAAIGTNGAKLAKEIMENELVMSTDAYKNGNLVILENSTAWYTAEGGVTALDLMLSDLEGALLQ